MRQHMVSCLL